jgi:carboxypeptidase C (cathepsin A)
MPPRLGDNEASRLAFSDLVFVDPIGTGFSRVIERPPAKDSSAEKGSAEKGDPSKPEDP